LISVDGFAVGVGRDEIEESQQCVLVGAELLEGPTRPFGGFADFDVTGERLLDHVQQFLSLSPLEVALDLFRDFQQAISELGSIRASPDPLFQIPRHGGWNCNQRAPAIRDPDFRDCRELPVVVQLSCAPRVWRSTRLA
jgi:hypothetical protein